eukprot:m.336114 g.336114  ORF g.336114 m.336114 type:complete len:306 (-) comp17762_c0_seq1:21-938(-)
MPSSVLVLMSCFAAFALSNAQAIPPVAKTREIAPGVVMPSVNLGTCCGSEPKVGLKPWLDAGGRGIDTAYDYQDQTDIAAVLSTYPVKREDLFILTKVPAGFGRAPGDCSVNPNISYGYVKENLKELNTSYVDIVLLHHPCPTSEMDIALWKGLERALAEGLTKSIGISNYNSDQIAALTAASKVYPALNQCSMSVSRHDDATISYCLEHNITYEAFDAMKGCPFTNPKAIAIAKNHNVGVSQVCLRYILQRGAIMAVGTGSDPTTVGPYAKEDMDLFGFNLTAEEMNTMGNIGVQPQTQNTNQL